MQSKMRSTLRLPGITLCCFRSCVRLTLWCTVSKDTTTLVTPLCFSIYESPSIHQITNHWQSLVVDEEVKFIPERTQQLSKYACICTMWLTFLKQVKTMRSKLSMRLYWPVWVFLREISIPELEIFKSRKWALSLLKSTKV